MTEPRKRFAAMPQNEQRRILDLDLWSRLTALCPELASYKVQGPYLDELGKEKDRKEIGHWLSFGTVKSGVTVRFNHILGIGLSPQEHAHALNRLMVHYGYPNRFEHRKPESKNRLSIWTIVHLGDSSDEAEELDHVLDIWQVVKSYRDTLAKPCPIPDVLYRYQALNANTLSSLIDRTVWFADPREFNDPFDCRFDILDEPSPKMYSMPGGLAVRSFKEEASARSTGQSYDHWEDYRTILNDSLAKVGIVCLSAANNNMLLWSHYTANHTGFCLAFGPPAQALADPIAVDYSLPISRILRSELFERKDKYLKSVFYGKAKEWEYEHEYRIVVDINENTPGRLRPWKDYMNLTAIYLGLKMPEQQKRTIRRIFAGDADVAIHEMEQVPGQLAVRPKLAEGGL